MAPVICRNVQAVRVNVMSNNTAKPASSKSAQPLVALTSSPSTDGAVKAKPNSGSNPGSFSGRSPVPMTAESRRAMIAEAAYYIAEQRGFTSGSEVEDWLLAEKQIDSALSA